MDRTGGQRERPRKDPIELAHANWERAGWSSAADGMALVTSVMRVQQAMLSRADAVLRPLGLTFARFEVLMLLRFTRTGSLPVGKVGERLQVHAASVTNAVQRLEADGLVRRERSEHDGRMVFATITDDGRELVERAAKALNTEVFEEIPLERAEQDAAYRALRAWRRSFDDFDTD